MTISSSEAFPARSPMLLTVHSTSGRNAALRGGQGIGDGQAQIIMAVGGENHFVGRRGLF